ncbi:MAG TPA: ABC transporter permease [Thermoanaerobaculia bacterium]
MIGHLLRLVWNRKRSNALIVAEILASFLVTFAVMTAVVTFASNWLRPVGYEWRNVWSVGLGIDFESIQQPTPELREAVMRMVREAESFPEVLGAAISTTPPFAGSTSEHQREIEGRPVTYVVDEVSDGFARVMEMQVISGRWFGPADDGSPNLPVVIDATFAADVYPGVDPVGRLLTGDSGEVQVPLEIVGVVSAYRKDGELSMPVNTMFQRIAPAAEGSIGGSIVVKVRPGTSPVFEQKLLERLQAVAPEVSLRVRSLEQGRARTLRAVIAPLLAGAIVALFLILMVGLGLTGVLWQNVTRRTREIGLRRAMGATGLAVHRQILLEVLLLTTFALAAGAAIVLQLPILGAFKIVSPAAFSAGLVAGLVTIYSLAVLCALYPSWLASRLQPADALRSE